jgi:hypothetical protein
MDCGLPFVLELSKEDDPMTEIVCWSFVVALTPIILSIGSRSIATAMKLLTCAADHPFDLHRGVRRTVHCSSYHTGRAKGLGHEH